MTGHGHLARLYLAPYAIPHLLPGTRLHMAIKVYGRIREQPGWSLSAVRFETGPRVYFFDLLLLSYQPHSTTGTRQDYYR